MNIYEVLFTAKQYIKQHVKIDGVACHISRRVPLLQKVNV